MHIVHFYEHGRQEKLKYQKSQYSSFKGSLEMRSTSAWCWEILTHAALLDTHALRAVWRAGFGGARRGKLRWRVHPMDRATSWDCPRAPAGPNLGTEPQRRPTQGPRLQDTEMSSHHGTQGQHRWSSHTPCPKSLLPTVDISLLCY